MKSRSCKIEFNFFGKDDSFVKSPFYPIFVIPAKAGIQLIQVVVSA